MYPQVLLLPSKYSGRESTCGHPISCRPRTSGRSPPPRPSLHVPLSLSPFFFFFFLFFFCGLVMQSLPLLRSSTLSCFSSSFVFFVFLFIFIIFLSLFCFFFCSSSSSLLDSSPIFSRLSHLHLRPSTSTSRASLFVPNSLAFDSLPRPSPVDSLTTTTTYYYQLRLLRLLLYYDNSTRPRSPLKS